MSQNFPMFFFFFFFPTGENKQLTLILANKWVLFSPYSCTFSPLLTFPLPKLMVTSSQWGNRRLHWSFLAYLLRSSYMQVLCLSYTLDRDIFLFSIKTSQLMLWWFPKVTITVIGLRGYFSSFLFWKLGTMRIDLFLI